MTEIDLNESVNRDDEFDLMIEETGVTKRGTIHSPAKFD
jgi:hypothetical protein